MYFIAPAYHIAAFLLAAWPPLNQNACYLMLPSPLALGSKYPAANFAREQSRADMAVWDHSLNGPASCLLQLLVLRWFRSRL